MAHFDSRIVCILFHFDEYFSDTDAAKNVLIFILLLIAAKIFLVFSDTESAFITYKPFGEKAVGQFSQAINKVGGFPNPDPVLFDLDNYLFTWCKFNIQKLQVNQKLE